MAFESSFDSLRKHAAFSEELLKQLEEDRTFIQKTASSRGVAALKGVLPHLGVALGAATLTGSYAYWAAKKRYEAHEDNLNKSFSSLLSSHKDYLENPSAFQQRFAELSLISPTVASNPRLAHKVIAPRMDAGFDLDDVHRLSAIEYHTGLSPKIVAPNLAAQAQAASSLGEWVRFLYPQMATQLVVAPFAKSVATDIKKQRESSEDLGKHIEKVFDQKRRKAQNEHPDESFSPAALEILKREGLLSPKKDDPGKGGGGMGKTSSDEQKLLVSDECMGRMLADRYCMMKSAGAIQNVGKFFKPGADALQNYVKVMALPLAIGGGMKLVSDLMKQRATDKMKADAERVFAGIRRSNELVQENPQLAQEAFDTLKSFAPSLATKPIIARTFVEHVVRSNGMLPPDTANTLAKTEQLIQQLNDTTGGGFIEGLKNPMSLFKHTVSKGVASGKKGDEE